MPSLDLGVIGNGVVAALIDRRGRIVWHCLPRFDGDPVFCSLLNGEDPDEGFAEVVLENFADAQQAYLGNSAILTTVLTDANGASVRLTDFCPRFKQFDRIFRPAMLVRRIEPLSGLPVIRLRIRPLSRYGSQRPQRTFGSNHIRYVSGELVLRLTTDAPLSYLESEVAFALTTPLNIILGPDETLPASIPHSVRDFEERSFDYWSEWSRYLSVPFEWQDAVIRAADHPEAVQLRGHRRHRRGADDLDSRGARHGAQLGLPLLLAARRLLRRADALNRLGATRTMEDYLRLHAHTVVAARETGDLQPRLRHRPGAELDESQDRAPARLSRHGPGARRQPALRQRQHDVYGSIDARRGADVLRPAACPTGDVDDLRPARALGARPRRLSQARCRHVGVPQPRASPHLSAAMSWAACDRLAKIAGALGAAPSAPHWRAPRRRDPRADSSNGRWNEKRRPSSSVSAATSSTPACC